MFVDGLHRAVGLEAGVLSVYGAEPPFETPCSPSLDRAASNEAELNGARYGR